MEQKNYEPATVACTITVWAQQQQHDDVGERIRANVSE